MSHPTHHVEAGQVWFYREEGTGFQKGEALVTPYEVRAGGVGSSFPLAAISYVGGVVGSLVDSVCENCGLSTSVRACACSLEDRRPQVPKVRWVGALELMGGRPWVLMRNSMVMGKHAGCVEGCIKDREVFHSVACRGVEYRHPEEKVVKPLRLSVLGERLSSLDEDYVLSSWLLQTAEEQKERLDAVALLLTMSTECGASIVLPKEKVLRRSFHTAMLAVIAGHERHLRSLLGTFRKEKESSQTSPALQLYWERLIAAMEREQDRALRLCSSRKERP